MPATLSELFNGGVVTARHPALLAPGELQRADDCVYREKDPAIWRAPGRQKVNAVALGSVWAGSAAGVKGLAHLTFERSQRDQMLVYNGTIYGHASLSASAAGVIDAVDLQITATTTSGSKALTSAAQFGSVLVGWRVTGVGIAPGTTVDTVTDASNIVLSRKATANGTVTVTFNPVMEMAGPGTVAGTVSTGTTFTATTGFPFTQDVLGMQVFNFTNQSIIVIDVSGQSGTTGHYNVVTLSSALSNGATSLAFQGGVVQTFPNASQTNEMLDLAQFGGTYFVWNGRGEIQRMGYRVRPPITSGTDTFPLISSLITRPCGLRPVDDQPTVALITNAAYNWPASLSAGYYWFLVTEIFDPDNSTGIQGSNEVESNYTNLPVPKLLPAITGYGIRVTFPDVTNGGQDGRIATHWGIYMYGPTEDDSAQPSLAAFRRVAKVRISAATAQFHELHEDRDFQKKAPTATAAVTNYNQFTNPNGILVRSSFGTGFSVASAWGGPNGYLGVPEQGWTLQGIETAGITFGFNTGSPYSGYTITGIKVRVFARAEDDFPGGNTAAYYFYVESGSKKTIQQFGVVGKNWELRTHGGDLDTMGVSWVTSDLTSIRLVVGCPRAGQITDTFNRLRIDYVELEVVFQSGLINLNGPAFRCVTFRNMVGESVSVGARDRPPSASTGDTFQGSLVVNDLADETAIRFSLPGEAEYFPSPYVLRLNTTKRKDRVTLIRNLGQLLLVGLENGIKAIKYLPTEVDTDFHEGLAHEDLATDHGIPGPLAAVKFDWPGRGTVMAYASIAGVFVTDGITTKPLNNDLDWPNTVKMSALSSCVFRVYPKEKWLVLYYCPAGATHQRNTKALIFHYSADHVKNGDELPVTGPITVSGRSSTEVVLNGYMFLFSGHETNGFVYQEDFGVTQAAGYQVHNASDSLVDAPIVPFIRMRRMYPAGITHDCHLYKAYLLFSPFGVANVSKQATALKGATTIAMAGGSGTMVAGMYVVGTGVDAGTIIKSVTSQSEIVLSRAINADVSGVSWTFDTGTLAMTDRGASIGEAAAGMHVLYGNTRTGDMLVLQLDDTRQGLELQIEKVPLTFTTNSDGYRFDTATWADLGVNMRLHQAMILFDDQGPEQSRIAA